MVLDDARRIVLGRVLSGLAILMAVGGLTFTIVAGYWEIAQEVIAPVNALAGIGFGAVAWAVLPSQPRNRAVWAYAWSGFFGGLFCAAMGLLVASAPESMLDSGAGLSAANAQLPLAPAIAQQIMIVSWFPATFIAMTFGLLLFPDGHLPSSRWRLMAWCNAITVAAGTIGLAVLYHPWSSVPIDSFDSSFGSVVETIVIVAQVGALGAVASLVARYRSSDQIKRLQIRWITTAAAAVVVAFVLVLVLVAWGGVGGEGGAVYTIVLLVPLAGLILAFGIAISRYDLFDIDLVVSKSVTYLGLGAIITLVYGTIVAVPVLLLGRSGDGGSFLFPIAAAAVVAIVFDPVRAVLHRWANRLVYGERSTPYEVLSRMTAVLAEARSGAGVDDLAALLAAGTGASRATVWIHDHDVLTPVGSWPADQLAGPTSISLDEIAQRADTVVAAIRRGEESLGALSVTKPRNDPVTDRDRQLVADAAGTAGLLVRNLALNGELQARARDLEASRSRLIDAQDAARQRLERDLHEGRSSGWSPCG